MATAVFECHIGMRAVGCSFKGQSMMMLGLIVPVPVKQAT